MVKRISKSPAEIMLMLAEQPKYRVELMGIYAYLLSLAESKRSWGVEKKGEDIRANLKMAKDRFSECIQILQELEVISFRWIESSVGKKPFYKLIHVGVQDVYEMLAKIKETGEVPENTPYNYGDGIFIVVLEPEILPIVSAGRTNKNKFLDPIWFKQLADMETYKGIDIMEEKLRCETWCHERNYIPTGRRFLTWLQNAKKYRTRDSAGQISKKIGEYNFDGML